MVLFRKKLDFSMTDMHTHILPETDDGAKDINTSVAMLEIAHEEGINTMIVTPHYHPGKCMTDQAIIAERIELFRDIAKQLYPDFRIYAGREIYYTGGISENIRSRKLTINNSRYALVEFDFHETRQNIRNAMYNIMSEGLIPIIAHIERYTDCVRGWDFVYELKDMGVVIQINAASVTGEGGSEVKKYVRSLLKEEIVDIIATDAHSAGHRSPRMKEAVLWVAARCGNEYARKISCDNPERIISDMYLD